MSKKSKRMWDTRTMVIIAVFVAIGAVVTFVEIPIMPAAPWLKYDPSGAVALIAGFTFGPVAGATVAILSWLPRFFVGPIGAVMNSIAALAMVIPAAYIYRRTHTMTGAVKGMAVGLVCSVAAAVILNFVATPLFMGANPQDVAKMIIPVLIPFNLIKTLVNCGITLLLYKTVSKLVFGDKEQKEENLKNRRVRAMAAAESIHLNGNKSTQANKSTQENTEINNEN